MRDNFSNTQANKALIYIRPHTLAITIVVMLLFRIIQMLGLNQ